jgi:serine/threonine-protein kinase RsbW
MTDTSGAPDRGLSPPAGLSALVSEMPWRHDFPGEDSQLGGMRRWLRSLLPDCPARDDVIIVATELSSNAVLHTASGRGGWFTVEIARYEHAVRVAVADSGSPDGPRVIDDPASEHGRGMLVVRGLSATTGVCGDHRGRTVWADVPWDSADQELPRSQYEASICSGQDDLASRFAGIPTWFGRSTLLWWGLVGGELVAAPSAEDLARLLGRGQAIPAAGRPRSPDTTEICPQAVVAAGHCQQPSAPAPDGNGPLPGSELRNVQGSHGGPRVPPAPASGGRGTRADTGAFAAMAGSGRPATSAGGVRHGRD